VQGLFDCSKALRRPAHLGVAVSAELASEARAAEDSARQPIERREGTSSKESRIQGEQILSGTEAFVRAE
jgi:hypothetical protein